MTSPLIRLSPAVEDELGHQQAALVRSGQAAAPEYECLICREPGDMRREPSCAVVFVNEQAQLLCWVHARCGESTVHPMGELEARYGRADQEKPRQGGKRTAGVPDTTFTTLFLLRDEIYPGVVVVPGESTRIVIPGGPHLRDTTIESLRQQGLGPVDLSGQQWPVELDRWAVRVDRGHLARITKPGGTWWESDKRPALDADWRRAANATRKALFLVAATDLPEDDLAGFRAAIMAAAADERVVGALMPIRGTLS
ncbi:hypothetical protein ABT324_28125 [Saccharopolyspora sp. NPDC000359]|uniref:hypothetical protein n=1 Tax=Saccharopolyspora sp. NPDC000359 TaxID=3154251 RepID=UPI003325EF8B